MLGVKESDIVAAANKMLYKLGSDDVEVINTVADVCESRLDTYFYAAFVAQGPGSWPGIPSASMDRARLLGIQQHG